MNAHVRLLLFLLFMLGVSTLASAKPVNTTFTGLALKGYDPVAYFTLGRPVKGDARLTFEWKGATWRFSTTEHRNAFVAEPERYAPSYGGYCAWAMSQGRLANIDPEAWKIVSGKLYLNYNDDIQKRWERDIPGFIAKADAAWVRQLNP